MSDKPKTKATVGEIFAAVSGIITEGANLCKQGMKINDHPVSALASDGAMKLWDAKYTAINRPNRTPEDQDCFVKPLLKFLEASLPVLEKHKTLGNVAKISEHVAEILENESSAAPRAYAAFKDGGLLAKPFKADYTAKEEPEVSADPDDIALELAADEPAPKANRGPVKAKAAAPSPSPAFAA